ncbi:inositol monophosphatase [Membranicola marinus]|uniref:Inositol-1-monophosphatase n=1 Tax=Membranihabitans marinus TaxID=1227546 RepID=A0A953HQW2_9BACT|nr:inositol monophosphatase family protein [Membranihabitans marinus]MBY5956646.1 inositol monophosphatase [Membranihabitans marinus]
MKVPFQEDAYKDIIEVGQKAASFIRQHFQKKDFEEETKAHDNSLVSYVDRQAEQIITRGLAELYPDYGFITEENTIRQDDQRDYYWIIDPLDGTTNFLHGLEIFSVSIALSNRSGTLLWGLVIDVMNEDVYHAAKGQGAWKNDQRLIQGDSSLKMSLLSTGFPYYRFDKKTIYLTHLEGFMASCRGLRRCGSAALDLCHVAAGIYGGFFEYDLHLWDIAAGALIIRESGGVVTDFEQDHENWKLAGHVVAGNPRCHQEMFDQVIKRNPTQPKRTS